MIEKSIFPSDKILIFDGAQGTMLQARGMSPGSLPELMNVAQPEIVLSVHRDYVEAGAEVLTTNTFGGNRFKLEEYSLENRVDELNFQGVCLAKKAGGTKAKVAASIGPTGKFVAPLGEFSFDKIYEVFKEQARALAAAQPDYFILETFSDLGEIRAALLACLDVADIPVICSLTYENGHTLTGVTPASAAAVLTSMGAAVIGANCSGGPAELLPILRELAENTELPLIVQPNAGLPILKDNQVWYPLQAENFGREMSPYLEMGINIIGSCCGSTPEHTTALIREIEERAATPRKKNIEGGRLSGRESHVKTGENYLPLIIGERLNPTARKVIAESLKNKEYGVLQEEAILQQEAGAHLLDVNVGVPGINEPEIMEELINVLQQTVTIPLCIDSTNPQVIEGALKTYHGKALVNSVNGEKESCAKILPLVKRYGAAVIALTLDEKGIPEQAEGRVQIAKKILEKTDELGIPRRDVFVDCLVMTAGTNPASVRETLKAIRMVKKELRTQTVLGVSNVSHGLPNRSILNASFLAMAVEAGLDAAIINPLDEKMFDSWQSSALLSGRDRRGENYLALNTNVAKTETAKNQTKESEEISMENVSEMVIRGSRDIVKLIDALLDRGESPLEIINLGLAKGLEVVGEKFEKGEFFLPQLMFSAEAAQKGFERLEAEMKKEGQAEQAKETVVIGTVKGDIHDIGKNMVAVMLKNHGYRVVDLGKNISAAEFLEAVKKEQAKYLALSSLMTTTMTNIPEIVKLVKKEYPEVKIVVGGAVVTAEYALQAEADGYSKDAVGAVKLLGKLSNGNNSEFIEC